MKTVKELKEEYKDQYVDVEVYKILSRNGHGETFHTDSIEYQDEYDNDTEVTDYELMSKERYFATIEANTSAFAKDTEDDQFPVLIVGIK